MAVVMFRGDAWTQSTVDRAIDLLHATTAEDRSVREPPMIGYRSAHRDIGPLAPAHLEGPIRDLARSIGRRLDEVL